MEKEIKIGSAVFEINVNAYTPVLYRECFGRDIFTDTLNVNRKKAKGKFELAIRMIYVMMKDRSRAKQVGCNDVLEAFPEILDIWRQNMAVCVDSKNKAGSGKPFTFSLYLLRCVQLGLSISDLQLLTVGMIFDLYRELSNSKESEENGVREATQDDIDAF